MDTYSRSKQIFYCDYRDPEDTVTFQHSFNPPPPHGTGEQFRVPPESHLKYEMCYVLRGTIQHEVEGEKFIVNTGDIALINFNEVHSLKIDLENGYERKVLSFTESALAAPPGLPPEADILEMFYSRKYGYKTVIQRELLEKTPFDSLMNEIEFYCGKNDAYYHPLIKALLVRILYVLSDIYRSDKETLRPSGVNLNIKKILHYINDRVTEKITLDEIANRFFINKYYLCHFFKEEMHMTVLQYVTHTKIRHAVTLMTRGASPQEACDALNFESYSAFYKTFRKVMKQSPREFCSRFHTR